MSQCQNFFDDKSPSICKSSSSSEQQQLSPSSTIVEGDGEAEDRNLELRLGPSADASRPKLHEMVRPIPLYPSLDRQRSGSHGNPAGSPPLFRGQSDSFLGEKALFSKDSAFSTPPLASRDQVWCSLRSSNAVKGSCPSKAVGDELTSPLLCRRSASMQVVIPSKEFSESAARPSMRRSCSNSIPVGLLSRQSSLGQEALVDESPDPTNSAVHHQQQDALELQRKKEIQAHRRLEARKRRRLILEKQQKKARQCNVPTSNKQAVSLVEKRNYSLDRKFSLECRPHLEITAAKIADGEDKMSNFHAQDTDDTMVQSILRQSIDEKQDAHGSVGKKPENVSCGGSGIQGALSNVRQMIASCDLLAHSGSKEGSPFEQGETNVEMINVSKMFPSSCSETDSIEETKEKEMYASERESSSQKSPTGNHTHHCISTGIAIPSSKPKLCLQTSPIVSSITSKVQMKSFQHQTPYLHPQKSNENEGIPVSQAPCHKGLDLLNEVPSDYTIKRSVGVFSEGKWRILDEDPNCHSIRRTTSNFHEAMSEPYCMTKKLESYASLSTSQLKFAGKLSDNTVSSLRSAQMQLHLPKLDPFEEEVKKHADTGRTDGTFLTHITSPIKVKEEQDPMDGEISECLAAINPPLHAPLKMESEPMNRQLSGSFSELPSVTTTGSGPNGRTINGVMYITSGRSVRLVCRCHGKHMSPVEFVEHAGSTDLSNPLRNIVVNCFPMTNHLSTPV